MGDRRERLERIAPFLPVLRKNEEPSIKNKSQLLILMQDLKDEGNALFKEEKYRDAWHHYCFALFCARQLEQTFYHNMEKEFLATMFCNASLCCLRTENYAEALKDADMALCCQSNNIKAMYRRAIALKELGRHKEALDQALAGQKLDDKNNFAVLIEEIKQLQKKPGKSKSSKGNPSPEVKSEVLADTNVVINEKKNMPPKNPKKKKGQSRPPKPENVAAANSRKSSMVVDEDDDVDSDSSIDNEEFATSMQNIQGRKSANRFASEAGARQKNSKTGADKNPNLEGFTTVKPKAGQQVRKQSASLYWPLKGYDFQLACHNCFIKQGEGPGGYKFRGQHSTCNHDILIVRDRTRHQLDWLKIRPRFISESGEEAYKYQMCIQFHSCQPCRWGEPSCTFAHNEPEKYLWNLDRGKTFSIHGFINEAKRQGIFSSEQASTTTTAKPQEVKSERYIPGLHQPGPRRSQTPSRATPPPQAQQQSQPYATAYSDPTFTARQPTSTDGGTRQSHAAVGGIAGLSTFEIPTNMPANFASHTSQYFEHPPPSYMTNELPTQAGFQNRSAYNHPSSPVLKQPTPPVIKQPLSPMTRPPPPIIKQPSSPLITQPPPPLNRPPPPPEPGFSYRMPNMNQPPPSHNYIPNPYPQLKFQLFCNHCLLYSGRPWYYFQKNITHQCSQMILAYYVQNDLKQNCWVQVRERASHRNFKGNYILCQSLRTKILDQCKYKENCSFAHNIIEQNLWKMEQEKCFDIGEFILQNKKQNTSPKTSQSSVSVKFLLDKFGGYFRFICRDCFFAPRPMISSQGEGNTCSGAARHPWNRSRIVAHVNQTTYTPVDERKFVHAGAFYLLCKDMQFCRLWLANRCRFAHSKVEREVWMLERDTNISREDLVANSAQLFMKNTQFQGPPPNQPFAGATPKSAQNTEPPRPSTPAASDPNLDSSINLAEFCRTCWGKGQRSKEDGNKDKCVRNHSNFKVNSVFVHLPSGKEIRSLPTLNAHMKFVLCAHHPKCTRPVCTYPHGEDELNVWKFMLKSGIKTLRELCDYQQEIQKNKTRKINVGESVVNVWGQASVANPQQSKSVNRIFAPGDLMINEHYCNYCGISSNSTRQWDEHCMSERHINNVNSDKEHQWNYRPPPWGQGNSLALCAKHLHNQSCQYSFVPDLYNLCKYAHSQEELDEWLERYEWRQLKRQVARERHMFSYTETLLEEYYSKDNSVNVISETLPGVTVVCNEKQVQYKNEKNATLTWIFEIKTVKSMEKVALLHNKDRLHFSLMSSDDSRHQVASGDPFLDVDDQGNACYKVTVCFTGGMFGSFSQWVVFDFGEKPVLVKKLAVEIGDHLQHERVKELRKDLSFDRWTSQNREIQRIPDTSLDDFTVDLLKRYKEPTASTDVVTMDSLTELNRHNYVHKMHKLLELEEITRHRIIAGYNLISKVTASQNLIETGVFLGAKSGDLFVKVNLSENLTEDTLGGKLVVDSVRTLLMAPVKSSRSNKVYEASVVGETNYGYVGRGKEYIYVVVNAATATALGLSPGKEVELEIQFQMDRKFFCRMHYALDSFQTSDVIFPDVIKFKPDINQLSSSMRIKSSVLNDDQMTAVRHIVMERDGYTPPFIMYGPFGTGKTETLAQATMTLLKERAKVKILICTQSNSAADLYIIKHLNIFFKRNKDKLKMLRLNAEERKVNTVPDEVKDYCFCPTGQKFEYPSKEYIQSHNLVLTTVENSMQLTKLGLYNFFTHIFIDEAGQTLECEILMPLTLATTKTCVVLTGDHHQIGPPVYSQEARHQKFDMSILVRLYNYYDQIANCGLAQVTERSQQSPLNIFLSINYRTKPEILRFISSVFYGGPDNLKAFGQVPSVIGITPLMFYAVQGTEIQNPDSTSYLNHAEAQEIFERVKELVDNWPKQWGEFNPRNVAVISTYADQIQLIRRMFRIDKTRQYLKDIDVGPIYSFQGKEVRALFISTVRTTNLLEETHIIRSLEAGEDIGDLGFLSNPKLINTALTRTQSYVAVVGDPIALCLIGECIQVWRTYFKHCSNMKSVRPHNYTYDFVRNQVVHIQAGPLGRVVNMITKRSQNSFKQSLSSKANKASKSPEKDEPKTNDVKEVPFMYAPGTEDLASGDGPYGSVNFGNMNQPTPTVKSSITPEFRHHLKQSRQFSHDKLYLSSDINCEDIIFQLAKENQKPGEAEDASLIKSEGITISEVNGFAVLFYNLKNTDRREPYAITTEDEDFNAFVIYDEDKNSSTVYENWSIDTLQSKLEDEPDKYVRCTLHTGASRTYASTISHFPPHQQALGNIDYEIEICGQLNRGHAFNGDEVVVQLLGHSENGTLEGQVKGILKRALDPNNRLFVCTSDSDNPGILIPVNPDMPRIYCLTSVARVKLARKGNICVYKFVSSGSIEFSHYEPAKASDNANHLFIVRYLTWEPGFLLPLGVVVGMLNLDDSLDKDMQVLEIEHNIKRAFRTQAIDETDQLFPPDFSLPPAMLQDRRDLTANFSFTINNPEAEDLEMAMTVSQVGNSYEVGLHVADVAAYVIKDSVLDQECEYRGGASLFPPGKEPKHMLPTQMCTDFCSLKPGFDRLAISVIVHVDERGNIFGSPDVFRSIINSKQQFSHSEVEEILLNNEESQNDYIKSCIVVLYQLSYAWRCERVGNGHMFYDLDPGKRVNLHSHLMLNEVKLRFNVLVAELLLSRFEETTPLLVQSAPHTERLEEWKKENAIHAVNSIPLTRAFLDDKVCQCNKVCTCVFIYMREHHLKNGDFLTMLKERWQMVYEAVGGENVDFELAQDLISNPENVPQIAVANHKLKSIQQQEMFICSQDIAEHERKHYGLCVTAYTNFTNPLRRFISLVVQRMLIAYVEGTASPYSSVEIEDICAQATATEREADKFNQSVFVMYLAHALKAHPVAVNALVKEVNKEKAVVSFEGITGLSEEHQIITLSMLPSVGVIQEQQSDSVRLLWEERVYEHRVRDTQTQYSSEVKLDPDRFVCSISSLQWQRLLIAAREKDETTMTACVQEITKQIGGETELKSKNYPEVLSDISRNGQVKHFVQFSFLLHESQALQVQLSVRLTQGLLIPSVQLLSLTPCLDICLEHRTDPTGCFANSSLANEAKATFTDEAKYASEWLLPILALESAHRAVCDGERITIHSISINWKKYQDVINGDTIGGSFTLSEEFCSHSCFQPDQVSTLVDGRLLFTDDPTFSLDYLCVRYKNLFIPAKAGLSETVAAIVNSDQPLTLVAHCRVTAVTKSAEGYLIKFTVMKSNVKMSDELITSGQISVLCTVEWIRKTWSHRVIDVAIRGLQNASSFAKEIVTGKKPYNTIDPLLQDNTILKNQLSKEQENVIAECYMQPLSVVIGGPGTGKSSVVARLAHLLVARNRKADTFRQIRSDGYTSQLMICAPTEISLDVITEHLIKLNHTYIHIVRVYSEEVEERDFPISHMPKPTQAANQSPDFTVMREVALHHLIRGKNNSESKSLLEQEMMTMYGKQMAAAVEASIRKAQTIELKKAHIILCTCITSARPILRQTANIKQIIIDDAGFVSESEALVPLVLHRGVNQLVLIGDPEMPRSQIKNPLASQLGLSRSLLQRYSERAQKLTVQYRCPPMLCSFPSNQFYGGCLNTSHQADLRCPAPTIPWPGDAGFPSVFCHVDGHESVSELQQSRGSDEDNIVNIKESLAVTNVIGALTQRHKVNARSILVLTMTNAQANIIRRNLPPGVAVSTVMNSIGQEADYVILSTVRGIPDSELQLPPSSEWTKNHLGQLANPQVMNLAITRARSALIVIGNKNLLANCAPWKSFLAIYRQRHSVETDARDFLQSLQQVFS